MKLLVLDGNSIVNRAFYGIKQLTTRDGRYTNGIYGFINILIKLKEDIKPDGVAIAFDLKAPTFRHKMYDGYKANRKGMPAELAEQMPVLKELLSAMGYKIVELTGYEADDILGTLSKACCEGGNECFIATGDRDSLQLVNDKVTVVLASTRMGGSEYIYYTPEKVEEKYGVEPRKLIDIKAIQGDSSDNIPGVAGIGEKGARDLISRFGSVDYIYNNLENIDIKDGIRKKLEQSRDMAFLSKELGTINLCVPIDTDIDSYKPAECDAEKTAGILRDLEMYKIIEKLGLNSSEISKRQDTPEYSVESVVTEDFQGLSEKIQSSNAVYFAAWLSGDDAEGLSFAVDGKVYSVKNDSILYFDFFKRIFESDIPKFVTDSKPLFALADRYGVKLNNVKMDCALAGYLLNPSSNDYGINRLCEENGITMPKIIAEQESDCDFLACVAVLPVLCAKLAAAIEANSQQKLLYEVEIPLARVLASMETLGFEVDRQGIEDYGKVLEKKIDTLTEQIYEAVGKTFNINSPKQLGVALFEDLGLPCKKKTKSGYSTKAEVLEELADEHPVVEKILEYRTLSKLKSTYCDGMLKVIAPDGRIHSSFNQTETRTGRISSTEPNLQNVPVRTPVGAEMRRFFVAKEGCVLVDADYSQIELRVLADIASDSTMIEAFNSGEDIHTTTASQVFSVPVNEVTPLMRSRAKAVNFGIVYGIGAFSLAKDIGVSFREADSYIKGYLLHYSAVDKYMKNTIESAKQQGFATTLLNRRRYLPELNSSNRMLRSFGERVARNMPIQGTAADIIKIAMVRTFERLERENLKSRLILQVHDELIVEAPEQEADYVKQLLKEEMENAFDMKVKLEADVNVGKTWYEAKG